MNNSIFCFIRNVPQKIKTLPAMLGDPGLITGSGRSPGKRNGNHSSILAWKSSWTEEPGGLQSMG